VSLVGVLSPNEIDTLCRLKWHSNEVGEMHKANLSFFINNSCLVTFVADSSSQLCDFSRICLIDLDLLKYSKNRHNNAAIDHECSANAELVNAAGLINIELSKHMWRARATKNLDFDFLKNRLDLFKNSHDFHWPWLLQIGLNCLFLFSGSCVSSTKREMPYIVQYDTRSPYQKAATAC
jgi:hypothetical protein